MDTVTIWLLVVVVLALVIAAARVIETMLPKFMSADEQQRIWIFTLLGLFLGMGSALCAIAAMLVFKITDIVVVSLVSSYNGVVLGATVTTTYNYWMGSSAGSKKKDEALAAAASTEAPGSGS